MAKKIKGTPPSEPLEDLDLDESLPPLEEGAKPSAGKDSTINLDEYGIWVKAEPEDFNAVESFDSEATELEDLSLEDEGKSAASAAPAGGESDAGMIDNLDIPEEETLPGLEELDEEKPLALDEEPITLDEEPITLDEEPAAPIVETVVRDEDAVPAASDEALESFSAPDAGGDFEEVSLDDLGIEISAEAPEEENAKKAPKRQTPPPPKVQPTSEDEQAHIIDDEFASLPLELEDLEAPGKPAEDKGGLELDELELPEEETIGGEKSADELELPTIEPEASLDAVGSETLEEIPELELGPEEPIELNLGADEAGEEIEVPLSDEVSIAESEEELGGLDTGLGGAAEPAAGDSSVLKKIEAELRSIKTELTQLKSELGVLRGKKAAGAGEARAAKGGGAQEGGDFFQEEEDETIALTGEELDNILVTADIKEEEKAEAEAEAEKTGATGLDLGEDIISYDEGPELEEKPREAAPAEGEAEELTLGDLETEKASGEPGGEIEIEIPDLDAEPGATPGAGAPEDLETIEELGADEGLELESTGTPALEENLEEVGELELEAGSGTPAALAAGPSDMHLPAGLKEEIKSVLGYMDQLLESLPEEKIEEFAKSEYFSIYKKLFEELGLVS